MDMRLSIHLLGQRRLLLGEQPLLFKILPRTPSLFAFLLVNRDTPILRNTLAFTIWPDATESRARANLRRHLHDLSKALPESPDDKPWIIRQGQFVQWNPAGDYWLDIAEFETLSQDPSLLTRAVEQYTGDFAPDVYDDWATFERDRLRNQYFAVLFQLIKQYQSQQAYRPALTYVERILREDPWREDMVREKLLLLQALGDRPGAIQAYERFQTELANELDITPMPETQAVFETILSGKRFTQSSTVNTPVISDVRLESSPDGLHHFPSYFAQFVGREAELQQVTAGLNDPSTRLLNLVGPGGMGKTRLCVAAVKKLNQEESRFVDGCYYIPLASIPSPNLLPLAIVQGLMGDVSVNKLAPIEQLLNFLRHKSLLLVLDNFEHLLLEGAELVSTLLKGAPGLCILITSREPLNLQAERRFVVSGLSFPSAGADTPTTDYDAIQLFQQAAQRTTLGISFSAADHTAIARICQLVQGMPLALEMAGAWTRLYDCQTIADEITRGLDFLVSHTQDTPDRHRSIRAVFEHSWNLLTVEQQQILLRLSVFPSHFSLSAALAIASAHALDLANLIDKSLLKRTLNNRFDLHELLRQFIQEKNANLPDDSSTLLHHQAYFNRFLQQRVDGLRGGKRVKAFNEVEQDWANIQQAWQVASSQHNTTTLSEMLYGLVQFLLERSRYAEGAILLQDTLDVFPGRGHPILQARLQAHLGYIYFRLGDMQQAEQLLEQSTASLKRTEFHPIAQQYLGELRTLQGNYQAAQSLLQQASQTAQRQRDNFLSSLINQHLGRVAQEQGRYETAQALLIEGLQQAEAGGWLLQKANIATVLAGVLTDTGDYKLAQTYYQTAITIYKIQNSKTGQAWSQFGNANLAYRLGDFDAATKGFQVAIELSQTIGNAIASATALIALANIAHETGYYSQALTHHMKAETLVAELDYKKGVAVCMNNIGNVWRDVGHFRQARQYFEGSLKIKREIGNPAGVAATLPNLALVLIQLNQLDQAQTLCDETLKLLQTLNNREWLAGTWLIVGHLHTAQQAWEKAQNAYQKAITLREEANQPHRSLEPLAGLTEVALHQNNLTEALELTEQILAYIAQDTISKSQQRFRVYLACIKTLQATRDPRAQDLLKTAHITLQEHAQRIDDTLMRQMFLTKVTWNAQLIALWEES